jgi:hypothetical protein
MGTYYIDATGGLDGNTGTAKITPWKHLPGMATATHGYIPVAGDIFILKGGETWLNADFPITWNWSGTAVNRITVTVDSTWFTGGSWTRPKFNAQGVVIVGPVRTGWAVNAFLDMNNSNFGVHDVTFDNIEMTGFYWKGNPAFNTYACVIAWTSLRVTLDHLYIHGWTHGTLAAPDNTRDFFNPIMGSTSVTAGTTNNDGCILQNSVIDGSDGTGGGDSGRNFQWPNYFNNVIHDLVSGIVGGASAPGGTVTISGNVIYNVHNSFDPTSHPNILETLGSSNTTTYYIYDNVFHDSQSGAESGYLANINIGANTFYVWNNLWYNLLGNSIEFENNTTAGTKSIYFWNNTIVPKANTYGCIHSVKAGGTPANFVIQNNHIISTIGVNNGIDPAIAAVNLVVDHNVLQTPAAATLQGYTASQTPYAYAPTDSADATVGSGVNLTANCTAVVTLCVDTQYGVAYDAVNHRAVLPSRTPVARAVSAAWDTGAYTSGDVIPPAPPIGVTVQ